MTKYHTWDEIENWLTTTVDDHEFTSVSSIGKTHLNREIYVVDIFEKHATFVGEDYPKIVVDCGIHAREWVSFSFCQHLINELLWGSYKEKRKKVFETMKKIH